MNLQHAVRLAILSQSVQENTGGGAAPMPPTLPATTGTPVKAEQSSIEKLAEGRAQAITGAVQAEAVAQMNQISVRVDTLKEAMTIWETDSQIQYHATLKMKLEQYDVKNSEKKELTKSNRNTLGEVNRIFAFIRALDLTTEGGKAEWEAFNRKLDGPGSYSEKVKMIPVRDARGATTSPTSNASVTAAIQGSGLTAADIAAAAKAKAAGVDISSTLEKPPVSDLSQTESAIKAEVAAGKAETVLKDAPSPELADVKTTTATRGEVLHPETDRRTKENRDSERDTFVVPQVPLDETLAKAIDTCPNDQLHGLMVHVANRLKSAGGLYATTGANMLDDLDDLNIASANIKQDSEEQVQQQAA